MKLYTLGHATMSLEAFVAVLQANGIEQVADIRSILRSRRNPQFNRNALPASLTRTGIAYTHLARLGGRRSRSKDLPAGCSPNGAWEKESFRNYADYALTPPFREGLAELVELGSRPTAAMCAEAVWWRCHRRIVADYLLTRGWTVLHLVPPALPTPHRLTAFAEIQSDGTIAYPAREEATHLPEIMPVASDSKLGDPTDWNSEAGRLREPIEVSP